MAGNPFDQFDAAPGLSTAAPVQGAPAPAAQASSNPFDQFGDAPDGAPSAPASAAPDETAGRVAGLGGRALIEGIGNLEDLPRTAGHAIDSAAVWLLKRAGAISPDYQLPTPQQVDQITGSPSASTAATDITNAAGLPTPATPTERIASAGVRAVPSALLSPETLVPSLISSVASGLAAQGVAEAGGGAVAQTAAGLAAGGLGGGLSGAITREGAAATSPAAQRLLDEGVPLNVAQATGNKAAQQVDRASQLLTSGAAGFAEKQQQAFNGAVLKRVGADPSATAATPEVLSDVRDRITGVMDDAAARGTTMDAPLATNLQAYRANLPAQVPDSAAAPIVKNLDDLQAAATANGGVIPGDVLQRIRTNLGGLTKNPQVGESASDLRDIIDDAVQRSTPAADQAALTLARQQYRTLKQIEPAVNQDGDISPKALMQTLQTKANRNQTLYGQGGDQSLVQLAKDARSVLPDKLGNSGTAERFLPLLSYLDAFVTDHPIAAVAKTTGLLASVGGAARLLRNQTVVRNAAGVAGGAVTGAKAGARAGSLGAQLGVVTPPAQ